MALYGNNNIPHAEDVMVQAVGSISGLIENLGSLPGPVVPLQLGDMSNAECACVMPTHCFRSVSQRSLNVPTKFSSAAFTYAPGDPGGILTGLISDPVTGALPGIDLDADSFIFNDANVQGQRGRINDLVLIALRAEVRVQVLDASPIAAGAIDLCDYANFLEDEVADTVNISLFHVADRREPWVDKTPLKYFRTKAGTFMPVPPLKWIDRDPAMALSLRAIDFGSDAGAAAGIPNVVSTVRPLDVKLSILVEALFIPDPAQCGDYWPGEICPPSSIGNTEYYTGAIKTARMLNGARG